MIIHCKHCEKTVAKGQPATAIISGTLGESSLDDFKNFYVFHENCFMEVGGEEYSPGFPKTIQQVPQTAQRDGNLAEYIEEKKQRSEWF